IEQSVATPLEQQMNGVDNMLYMMSTNANDGTMNLKVTFDVGTNVDIDQVNTQNRVSQSLAQLPDAVKREGVLVNRSSPDLLLAIGLYSPKGTYDAVFLSNYANINLVDAIKRVSGVGDVKNFTNQDYAMRIWVQPDKMAALGITPEEIAAAIREQNAQAPAGTVGSEPAPPGQEVQYNVRTAGLLREADEFADIVVRSNPDGSQVKIKDVARVELGAQTYDLQARLNQSPGAALGIYLAPGANALKTAEQVTRILQESEKRFPPDLEYEVTLDSTAPIVASLHKIQLTLIEAVLLVLVVVFIFLQSLRATIIPMLAVPVSLLGTFIAFPMLGFSVNTLTLFGMVLAIGIVVDDAIVVVEAVQHHIEHGLSPHDATVQAMKEVSGPVIAIALILCAVFVPVAFMTGVTGRLYQQFAITIAVSVIFSAINALTLSPALSAMLLRKPQPGRGPLGWFFGWFNRSFDRVTKGYGNIVDFFVRKAARSMLLLVVIIGGIWLLSKQLPGGFIPDEDKGYLYVAVQLPEGASLQRSDAVMKKVEQIISATKGVRSSLAISGFNILKGLVAPKAGLIFIGLDDWKKRDAPELHAEALARKLNAQFVRIPDARIFAFGPPPLPGYGNSSGFALQLQDRSGGSFDQLAAQVKDFMAEVSKRPEIGRVTTTLDAATPQIKVDLDREKTRSSGVNVDSVYATMQAFLSGLYVNDFVRFGRVFKVLLQAEPEDTNIPSKIGKFYVRNRDGKMVPLSTLVNIQQISGPNFVSRYNLYQAAEITGIPAPGYSSAQALNAIQEVAKRLPLGYSYEWSGLTYQEKKSEGEAGIIFGMAVIFVFLLLAAQYESWTLPFAVLLCTPLVVLGTFIGVLVRGYDNNVYVQIGLVMLIGLAAKNAILIVEFAKLQRERGKPTIEAALEASKLRLRPILMTSLAFIVGCIPLMLSSGSGAASRGVMGTAVVFGMTCATVIGIFLVPVCYVFVQRITDRGWSRIGPDKVSPEATKTQQGDIAKSEA
ncbi:MAG: multidrug efflux RND transporter permease subunit, partial [Verrucomicrobia bacterium]|nr:multidrug efflux RND transporter permease subunit [Verrucomicrobiota bacterium]